MREGDIAPPASNENDPVRLHWGINRWVLVEVDGRSEQRQVSTRGELVTFLIELGIPHGQSTALASAEWNRRPKRADETQAAAWEGLRNGVPNWAVLLAILAVIAVFLYFLIDISRN